jgi:hypothetical protein
MVPFPNEESEFSLPENEYDSLKKIVPPAKADVTKTQVTKTEAAKTKG